MSHHSQYFKKRAAELTEQMRALVENPGGMTQRDMERFDALEAEFRALQRDHKELQANQDQLRGFNLSKVNAYQRDRLEKLAFTEFVRCGSLPQEIAPLMKMAAQSTSDSGGGHTIPQGMIFDLEQALKSHGGMWENARIVKTERGNTTAWGYTNDTHNGAYILDESADGTASAAAVQFGSKEFKGFKYCSGVIQVSNELLQDSELFAQEFVSVLSERIFRGTNTHFTTGDGNGKPTGVATAATYGLSTTADGDIANVDFLNLTYTVDTAYRRRAKWMMHSTALKHIQKKAADSTSDDRPFWVPPYNMGDDPAGSLWGYPIVVNDDMPSFVGAETDADDNKKVVLFGDFQKYIIRQARDLRIVRLPQRFADTDETGIIVFMRVDGDLLNAGTDPVKYLRVSTT